jgi:hypothetical protein
MCEWNFVKKIPLKCQIFASFFFSSFTAIFGKVVSLLKYYQISGHKFHNFFCLFNGLLFSGVVVSLEIPQPQDLYSTI